MSTLSSEGYYINEVQSYLTQHMHVGEVQGSS
jgi:hypothetical protein